MILTQTWAHDLKLKILVDIISQKKGVALSSKEHNIPPSQVNGWLEDIFCKPVEETSGLIEPASKADQKQSFLYSNFTHNQIFIKDANHRYIGYNKLAEVAGSAVSLEYAIGKDDHEISPEFADIYEAHGQIALDEQKRHVASAPVYCRFIGWVTAEANIFPVIGDDGRSSAVVLAQHIDYSMKKHNFIKVSKAILSGFAKLFIQKSKYSVCLDDNYLFRRKGITTGKVTNKAKDIGIHLHKESYTVHFSRREAECLLYLLFRVPVKTIAHHMGISTKTVEKMITLMNMKMFVSTTNELIRVLTDLNFYEDF